MKKFLNSFCAVFVLTACLFVGCKAPSSGGGSEQGGGGGEGIVVSVTSVTVSKSDSVSVLTEGEYLQLTVTVLPSNATNKNVIWSSSDITKASIDSNGVVHALASGSVTITAVSQENSEKKGSINLDILASAIPVQGELEYELSSDETYYILKGIGTYTGTNIDIPAVYNSLPVKEISEKAFYWNEDITGVTIPESIEKIGRRAFYACEKLTQIIYNAVDCEDFTDSNSPFALYSDTTITRTCVIGNKVEKLPDYLLYSGNYKSNISSLVFEDNSSLKKIGKYIISNNSLLTELVIPASTQSIKQYAFAGLSGVESVKLYSANCVVQNNWFTNYVYGQDRKSIRYYFGPDCTEIPSYFANGKTIESLTIDGTITKIGYSAFENSIFNYVFTLPSTVTVIGDYAFREVKNLTETLDLSSVESLGSNAFALTNIKSIDFGDKLKTIPDRVITRTPVETIRIGKAVTMIESGAFYNCASIKKLEFYSSDVMDGVKGSYSGSPNDIYQLFNVDKSIDYSKDINIVIGSNVKRIPAYLFYNDSTRMEGRICSITFEEAVNGEEVDLTIGKYAFYSQNNLTSLEIPSRCSYVDEYSFFECTGMSHLKINAAKVKRTAFNGCSATYVSIGKSCDYIYIDNISSVETLYFNAQNAHAFNAEQIGTSTAPLKVVIGADVESIPQEFMTHTGNYDPKSNYVSELIFEENSKLKCIQNRFLDDCATDQIHNLVLPETVETAFLTELDLNYLYVGKNVKKIRAKVSKTVDGKVPFIDFNAEEISDRTGSGVSELLYCSSSTIIKIGKNVKYISMEFLYNSTADIVYFEQGCICSEIRGNAFCEAKVNILVIPSSLQEVADGAFTFTNIANIYSEKDYTALNAITNWNSFFNHDLNATKYYYSESNKSGYWHYDENGVPVLW